jgi:hypothetical protein
VVLHQNAELQLQPLNGYKMSAPAQRSVFQLTAPAGALKIAGFLMNAFPIYRCDGRRVGS